MLPKASPYAAAKAALPAAKAPAKVLPPPPPVKEYNPYADMESAEVSNRGKNLTEVGRYYVQITDIEMGYVRAGNPKFVIKFDVVSVSEGITCVVAGDSAEYFSMKSSRLDLEKMYAQDMKLWTAIIYGVSPNEVTAEMGPSIFQEGAAVGCCVLMEGSLYTSAKTQKTSVIVKPVRRWTPEEQAHFGVFEPEAPTEGESL